MNKFTINACPLCNGAQMKCTQTCTDNYATGEVFAIFRCENCGFQFTQDFPVESEMGRYYETPDYISHSDSKKGVVNELYHVIRKHMLTRKAKLISRALGKDSGRILDIGTGTGYFPYFMKEHGWQVEAVEKNAHARLFAMEHFGLDVNDETTLAELPDSNFDAITLWHVMEHLEHLNEMWERLYRLLDENGILVIAVPNCDSYDAKKYGPLWAAYDVPRHLWHFTPHTMKQFGEKHGFLLTEQHPMPFDAFYVSILSEKHNRGKHPLLNGMVTGTASWFAASGKPERSSSIIYVFKKKK